MSLIEEFPQIIRNGKRVFEKVKNNVKSANSVGGGGHFHCKIMNL